MIDTNRNSHFEVKFYSDKAKSKLIATQDRIDFSVEEIKSQIKLSLEGYKGGCFLPAPAGTVAYTIRWTGYYKEDSTSAAERATGVQ